MSVTRGASSYLSSELRGHRAFVSSRKLVEVGNRGRKPWRKRWYADTANFFFDGQHLFSCQGPTLGVTTESGPILLKELVARRSYLLLCWCARWVGWTHAKHRTFLVRKSTGFNIWSHMGESTRLSERSDFSPLVSLTVLVCSVSWVNHAKLPCKEIKQVRVARANHCQN